MHCILIKISSKIIRCKAYFVKIWQDSARADAQCIFRLPLKTSDAPRLVRLRTTLAVLAVEPSSFKSAVQFNKKNPPQGRTFFVGWGGRIHTIPSHKPCYYAKSIS